MEKWHYKPGENLDCIRTVPFEAMEPLGNEHFVAFVQHIEDKAEQARRAVLLTRAPELFAIAERLDSFIGPKTLRSAVKKDADECEKMMELLETIRKELREASKVS